MTGNLQQKFPPENFNGELETSSNINVRELTFYWLEKGSRGIWVDNKVSLTDLTHVSSQPYLLEDEVN